MLIVLLFAVLPATGDGGALAKNIPGAFGLEFDVPVAADTLGASVGHPPYPSLPLNLTQEPVARAPDSPSSWYRFDPRFVPKVLRTAETRFFVLLDNERRPARIVAEASVSPCGAAFKWINTNLRRKYLTDYDAAVPPRDGFAQATRYTFKNRQVDVACGDVLLIEYTDAEGAKRWIAEEHERLGEHQRRMEAYAEQEADLKRIEDLLAQENHERFADTFTIGDRYRLEGGLGIRFDKPFSRIREFPPDEPVPVELDTLPSLFADGNFDITLAPDRIPIRIAAILPDPEGEGFKKVSKALKAKYGAPMKDGETHKIYKVNGNFVVARNDTRAQCLNVVFINNEARKQQREREVERKHAEWEEETAGL